MTDQEKATLCSTLLLPEVVSASDLLPYVQIAEEIVIQRRYPFGNGDSVPTKYEKIQCQIAVEIYSRKGAEGELAHTENGISRNYASGFVSSALLNLITPLCNSVNESS